MINYHIEQCCTQVPHQQEVTMPAGIVWQYIRGINTSHAIHEGGIERVGGQHTSTKPDSVHTTNKWQYTVSSQV